jgi:hypothetical protein
MEINLVNPDPLLSLNIYHFITKLNVDVDTQLQDTDSDSTMTGGGEQPQGFYKYFQQVLNAFGAQEKRDLAHSQQNQTHMQKLFYSGQPTANPPPPVEEERKDDVVLPSVNNTLSKVIITTSNPNINLVESLKGTKLSYMYSRSDVPSRWV